MPLGARVASRLRDTIDLLQALRAMPLVLRHQALVDTQLLNLEERIEHLEAVTGELYVGPKERQT